MMDETALSGEDIAALVDYAHRKYAKERYPLSLELARGQGSN